MTAQSGMKIVRLATFVVLAVVISGIGMNGTGLLAPDVPADAKLRHIIMLLPSAFFIVAIWMVQRTFRAIASGQFIEHALANLLRSLGVCLFLGGLSFVFFQPVLLRTLTSNWSAWAWFDVPAITLGCLGLMLFVLSPILRDAGRARAELEEIL